MSAQNRIAVRVCAFAPAVKKFIINKKLPTVGFAGLYCKGRYAIRWTAARWTDKEIKSPETRRNNELAELRTKVELLQKFLSESRRKWSWSIVSLNDFAVDTVFNPCAVSLKCYYAWRNQQTKEPRNQWLANIIRNVSDAVNRLTGAVGLLVFRKSAAKQKFICLFLFNLYIFSQ